MLILSSILAIFVYGMIAATLGTILPDLSSRFGLTPSQNGKIAFAQAMGLMIASLLVGPLMDQEGIKVGLVLGLALAFATLLTLPKSRGFAMIALLLFVLGLGGGMIVTGANSLASSVSDTYRATTLNLVNLFFGLGGLATPFISANLLSKNSARLCYLMTAITGVTLAIHVATPMPRPSVTSTFAASQLRPLLASPVLLLLALLLFLYVACEVGVWNWLAQHLIAQGVPEARALNILSLGFALGLLIGRVVVSRVLVSVPALTVILWSSVAMAVSTYLMLHVKRPAVAAAFVFLAGIAMAPVFPTTLAIVAGVFPHLASTALGAVIACGWLGLAVSSQIIGAIAGGQSQRLKKALAIIPIFSVAMVVVSLAIGRLLR
jgi:fucose permease